MTDHNKELRVVFYSHSMRTLNTVHVNNFTKNIYGWMRVGRNKIWTMCGPKDSEECWSGSQIFDYDVCWDHLYEIGDSYVLPGEGEITLVRKDQMIDSPQRVHNWKSNKVYTVHPWRDIVYYSKKTKRYNIEQRLDQNLLENPFL